MHFLTDARVKVMARQLLEACGGGRVLLIGAIDSRLVVELRALCSAVDTCAALTDVVASGDGEARRGLDDAMMPHVGVHDVVVFVCVRPATLPSGDAAKWALQHARNAVCVLVVAKEEVRTSRAEMDAVFFKVGARRHPAHAFLAPYAELDSPSSERWWIFESVPGSGGDQNTLTEASTSTAVLEDEASDASASAEARLATYFHACQFVRPGDRVLDFRSGVGAGVRLISRMTRAAHIRGLVAGSRAKAHAEDLVGIADGGRIDFKAGGKSSLARLPGESSDFCVAIARRPGDLLSFEYLKDAFRLLSPGGRLLIGMPAEVLKRPASGDKYGRSSSAWQSLSAALVGVGFQLERGWLQFHPGASGNGPRGFVEFDLQLGVVADEEGGIVVLAMKSPMIGTLSDQATDDSVPNILAFSRDYAYPALVRAMVSIGLRATSPELLGDLAKQALLSAPPGSADAGAALSVQLYRCLAVVRRDGEEAADSLGQLLEAAETYVFTPHQTPTGYRWRISVAFAAALLWQAVGAIAEARRLFAWVAECDPAYFSPLLGTKTVGAAVLLGRIEHSGGNVDAAVGWWTRALKETQRILDDMDWREVLGDESRPETFGMPELALVIRQAGLAAAGLRGVSESAPSTGPQGVWKLVNSSLDDQLDNSLLVNELLRQGLAQSEQAKAWLGARHEEDVSWIRELEESKQWLASQLESMTEECDRRGADLESLSEHRSELMVSKAWLASNADALKEECDRRGAALDEAGVERAALVEAKDWLAAQVESLGDECDRLRSRIDQIEAGKMDLQQGKDWLSSQVDSLAAELARQQGAVDTLSLQQAELMESKAWLESQLQSYVAECGRRDERIGQLERERDSSIEAVVALELNTTVWQQEVARLSVELAEANSASEGLRKEAARLAESAQWMSSQVASWRSEAERTIAESLVLQASLDQAVQEVATVQQERAVAEDWLQAQVSSWQQEAEGKGMALELQQHEAERLSGDNARLQAALDEAAHVAKATQRDWAASTEKLEAQVSFWQQEADARVAALANIKRELDDMRLAWDQLKIELESTIGQKAKMENSKWVRFGMKLGVMQDAGGGK